MSDIDYHQCSCTKCGFKGLWSSLKTISSWNPCGCDIESWEEYILPFGVLAIFDEISE